MKNKKTVSIAYLDFDDIKNPLLAAGQATATYEVGSVLTKRGHMITVYCSRFPGYKDRVENGIKYIHVGIGTSNIKINNMFYILTTFFTVRKIRNADVIIECFTAPVSTLFSPVFTKIPVIALPSMFNAKEFSKKYYLPFHWIERIGMKFYQYMLPYSDIDSAKAKKLNHNIEYKIVPQGVGKEYFAIKHKKSEFILFLGRFDCNQKGIDLLLNAYAKVQDTIVYPLVIAGHGPDKKKIEAMIRELELSNRASVIGPAYGKKKFELLQRAAFVVFPSRHDELSLWALEALAAGMPLVTFDLPEARWMGHKAVLKAKPFDIEEYSKLLTIAAEIEVQKNMKIEARKLAGKYSWEKVADQFEEFIFSVMNKQKGEKYYA